MQSTTTLTTGFLTIQSSTAMSNSLSTSARTVVKQWSATTANLITASNTNVRKTLMIKNTNLRTITLLTADEYKEIAAELAKAAEKNSDIAKVVAEGNAEGLRSAVEKQLGTYAANAYMDSIGSPNNIGERVVNVNPFAHKSKRQKQKERNERKFEREIAINEKFNNVLLHVDKLDELHTEEEGFCVECDLEYPCPTIKIVDDILESDVIDPPKTYLALDIPKHSSLFKAKFWGVFLTKKAAIEYIRANLCFCDKHRYHIVVSENPYTNEEKLIQQVFCDDKEFVKYQSSYGNTRINYRSLNAQ